MCRQVGIIINQAHHILCKLNHEASRVYQFTQSLCVRLLTSYQNLLDRTDQIDSTLAEADVSTGSGGILSFIII